VVGISKSTRLALVQIFELGFTIQVFCPFLMFLVTATFFLLSYSVWVQDIFKLKLFAISVLFISVLAIPLSLGVTNR